MTTYIDLEEYISADGLENQFDLLIVGGGAAGLTICRALSNLGARIGILESGALEQSPEHEALNAVDVVGYLEDRELQKGRKEWHAEQLPLWESDTQKFGVRCRVLGGSTAGWAGKVAPFDPIDYEARDWVPNSGWPVNYDDMAPWIEKAARELDLGPIVTNDSFWSEAGRDVPEEMTGFSSFTSFFWQFARSTRSMTDVKRFGPDFREETHPNVTVIYNATVSRLRAANGRIVGVSALPSLSGGTSVDVNAPFVVLSASAIENARLLLMSRDENGRQLGNEHGTVGRYLIDHPCMPVGEFEPEEIDVPARLFGFYGVQRNYRAFMYSHGLAMRPEKQRAQSMPNMAIFPSPQMSDDDPINALIRLAQRSSSNAMRDLKLILGSPVLVTSMLGRKALESPKVPLRIRRLIADAAVWLNANFVARNYASKGRGRSVERLTLELISEQPPSPENYIALSNDTDRLGLPKALVSWQIDPAHRKVMLEAALQLAEDFKAAGLNGFRLSNAAIAGDAEGLVIRDMAHTAGSTRMGFDPKTSVVDPDCKLHGLDGLYVAVASAFPTSGHANPTMVIMAFALRLAAHLRGLLRAQRMQDLAERRAALPDPSLQATVLVTGATGNIGSEVISELLGKGYAVRGQFRTTLPDDPRVDWRQFDFSDPAVSDADFSALVDGVDAVIHLAASLPENVGEMETSNVANLRRFAEICAAQGARYFGQASSMVVYGTPTTRVVTEDSPLIDLNAPLEKQYWADRATIDYACSKVKGEEILRALAGDMRVELQRIAVARPEAWLEQSLHWGLARRCMSLYRNTHFMSSRDTARALVHLMSSALESGKTGVEVFNICSTEPLTWRDVWVKAGKRPGLHVPFLYDVLKGMRLSRSLKLRYPQGAFRIDNSRLRSTGFVPEA